MWMMSGGIRLGKGADVDPVRADEIEEALRRQADRGGAGAGCGIDEVEILERDVAIDRERGSEAEGADAADGVTGDRLRLLAAQHARAGAEAVLGLAIVEPRVAARHQQHDLVLEAQRER